MGYSNFDKRDKRKKDRRKRKYNTQQLSQVESQMIQAEKKENGAHDSNSPGDRPSNSGGS